MYSIMDDYKAFLNNDTESSYQTKSEYQLASEFKEEFLKLLTAKIDNAQK